MNFLEAFEKLKSGEAITIKAKHLQGFEFYIDKNSSQITVYNRNYNQHIYDWKLSINDYLGEWYIV